MCRKSGTSILSSSCYTHWRTTPIWRRAPLPGSFLANACWGDMICIKINPHRFFSLEVCGNQLITRFASSGHALTSFASPVWLLVSLIEHIATVARCHAEEANVLRVSVSWKSNGVTRNS